jgi:3-hydroxyisobutyrate dehydrogenase-like beta-hydroxyacid dehydrogenase
MKRQRPEVVGIVGLGAMGLPIAQRVLAAGYAVRLHSRSSGPIGDLESRGALWRSSVAQLARDASVVLVAVATDADLMEVVDSPGDLIRSAQPGTIVCALGTHAPMTVVRMSLVATEAGIHFLDTPVSGGVEGAAGGTLAVMAGGGADDLARVRPILETFARSIVHIGPVGAGSIAKACNQLIVGSTILAVAEALTLAEASGLDPAVVRSAISGGYAASRVLEIHGRRMVEDDFVPGARIDLHAKDAEIVLDTARRAGVTLSGFEPVARALGDSVAAGDGALDHAALVRRVRERLTTAG